MSAVAGCPCWSGFSCESAWNGGVRCCADTDRQGDGCQSIATAATSKETPISRFEPALVRGIRIYPPGEVTVSPIMQIVA